MKLSILYRGQLSSCNYGCWYCPFAKHTETLAEHEVDRLALERFVAWVLSRNQDEISVLFTPWGEALINQRYQQALIKLTNASNVEKAVIQTNLSCRLNWLTDCDKSRLALWTTFHPSEISRKHFLNQCLELINQNVRFSVGAVGLKEQISELELLRQELPKEIYFWINAYKDKSDYYADEDLARLTAIDPLFPINNQRHASLAEPCQAGYSVISVAGDGTVQSCHFIKNKLGNIYDPNFDRVLQKRLCVNNTCGCHIGYVHLDKLNLYNTFTNGILERIPSQHIW